MNNMCRDNEMIMKYHELMLFYIFSLHSLIPILFKFNINLHCFDDFYLKIYIHTHTQTMNNEYSKYYRCLIYWLSSNQ